MRSPSFRSSHCEPGQPGQHRGLRGAAAAASGGDAHSGGHLPVPKLATQLPSLSVHDCTRAGLGEHWRRNTAAPQQDQAKVDLSSVEASAVGGHEMVCKVQSTVVRSLG